MGIAMLQDVEQTECDENIFSENYNKYHCKNCHNGIRSFLQMPALKQLKKHYVDPESCSNNLINPPHPQNLIKQDEDPKLRGVMSLS